MMEKTKASVLRQLEGDYEKACEAWVVELELLCEQERGRAVNHFAGRMEDTRKEGG